MKKITKLLCVILAAVLLASCETVPELQDAVFFRGTGDKEKVSAVIGHRDGQIETVDVQMAVYIANYDIPGVGESMTEHYDELFAPVKGKDFASVGYGQEGDYFVMRFTFTDLDKQENAELFASLELLPGYTADSDLAKVREMLIKEGYTESSQTE